MDVKCERCSTEYEFDDALVSGRGTTVKCTNCGHKFKIRRSDGDFSEDFWNVTTGDGRTLVFTSLRELQRAIQSYLVERNDRLSRGGLPPKAIGQIPELAPFFEQREAAKKSQQQGRSVKTQDGLGPAAATAAANAPPPVRPRQATKPEFPAPPSSEETPAMGKSTLIGTGPLSEQEAIPAAPEMRSRMASVPPPPTEREPEPSTSRFDGAPIAMPGGKTPTPPPAAGTPPPPRPQGTPPPVPPKRESMNTVPIQRPTPPPPTPVAKTTAVMATAPSKNPPGPPPPLPERARQSASHQPIATPPPVPPPPRPIVQQQQPQHYERPSDPQVGYDRHPSSNPHLEGSSPLPPPPRQRSLLREIEEERDRVRGPSASVPPDGPVSRRRGVGGFVVAVVVLICLATLGAVWAQKNLGITLGGKPPPTTPAVDPRVAGFLASGEKALADGNLDSAKESFDKASALSEKDPHVLLGIARLAAARADELWLKSRLLPADAADDHRITRERLSEMGMGARKAADDALTAQPDDPAALRAKIDALRISGDREGARALVAKINSNSSASQPETAYVLAALDLAEVEPLWPTVIERLKTAASAETGPGRARAALVFALARSGDGAGAKAEVDRLAAMPRVHPLLPLLRSVADKAKSSAKLDAGVDAAIAANDVGGFDAGKGHGPAVGPGGAAGGMPTDVRELVAQGEKARVKGDYERAKTLFTAAVDKNPNDSEALSGLASIAYAQRDLNGARASYKRVLAINPNYMPALVGLADVEWESGDKASATKMYKDIIDRYPEGAYPARIKQRAEGG